MTLQLLLHDTIEHDNDSVNDTPLVTIIANAKCKDVGTPPYASITTKNHNDTPASTTKNHDTKSVFKMFL